MDRRSLIKNAGIAGVLAAGVAPAVHAQAAVRWRLASSFPKVTGYHLRRGRSVREQDQEDVGRQVRDLRPCISCGSNVV